MIELGKALPLIDKTHKTEENIIKGCQSKVWIHAHLDGDKVKFTADSDAIITKGIIAILIRVFSNQHPRSIIDSNIDFIDNIGLRTFVSYSCKWSSIDGQTNKNVCCSFSNATKLKIMSEDMDTSILGEKIVGTLKTIFDPEILLIFMNWD